MSEPEQSSYKDLLAGIQELNKKETCDVYVISAKKTIKFSPLSVKQQKDMMSSGIDTDIESLSFTNTVNDVITENNTEKGVPIRVTDRSFILLQLRLNSVGEKLVVTEENKDYEINLKQHVEKCIKELKAPGNTKFNVSLDSIDIQCEVPILKTDTKINKQFTKNAQKTKDKQSPLELTDVIGDMYVHEIIKYIKQIKVGQHRVEFDDSVSLHQKLQVFESFPMKVSTEVGNKIRAARKIGDSVLEHDSLPEDVTLPIDASLFTTQD